MTRVRSEELEFPSRVRHYTCSAWSEITLIIIDYSRTPHLMQHKYPAVARAINTNVKIKKEENGL